MTTDRFAATDPLLDELDRLGYVVRHRSEVAAEQAVLQAAIAVCAKFATPNDLDRLREAVAEVVANPHTAVHTL